MPSFRSRRNITGANLRVPSDAGGHNLLNRAVSDCVASWNIRASRAAASKLLAAVSAWISPVRWRLNSSIGITWEYPPPAAPPLIPNVGPWLGCRMTVTTLRLRWAPSAWHRPTVVVDLPSPSGVGVMPTTQTYLSHELRLMNCVLQRRK
jgi:hypothetical protein